MHGALDRGPYLWGRLREPVAYAARGYVFEQGGSAHGYAWFFFRPGAPDTEDLILADWAAADEVALRTVLRLLGDHSTLSERVSWITGPFDPLLATLPAGRAELELAHYHLTRIVHVPAALQARSYPPGLSAELHLDVYDDCLEENQGRVILKIEDGHPSVDAGGEGSIGLDVGALASLYMAPHHGRAPCTRWPPDRQHRGSGPFVRGLQRPASHGSRLLLIGRRARPLALALRAAASRLACRQ